MSTVAEAARPLERATASGNISMSLEYHRAVQ